jgi:hypothetical protein
MRSDFRYDRADDIERDGRESFHRIAPGRVNVTSRLVAQRRPDERTRPIESPQVVATAAVVQAQAMAPEVDPFGIHLLGAREVTACERPVQARASAPLAMDSADIQRVAAAGVAAAGGAIPHADAIASAFGPMAPVVRGIEAHVGGAAGAAAAQIGAEAYATGNHVAFQAAPSLFTAAHEAAHVVQQRAGVHLLGGVGVVGDAYEQHADAVAARVVAGVSAADLLAPFAAVSSGRSVQRSPAHGATVQMPPLTMQRQYKPVVQAAPIVHPVLNLRDSYTQRFAVTNASMAPRGTTFQWNGGPEGLDVVKQLESDHGATIDLTVRATKPGPGKVQGHLTYTVPGAAPVTTAELVIPVLVPPLSATVQRATRLDRNGAPSSGPADRVAMDQAIRYTVKIGNLGGDGGSAPPLLLLTGPGASMFVPAGVALVAAAVDGPIVDVSLKPVGIGHAVGAMELAVAGVAPGAGPRAPFELHVEMERGRFLELCGTANTLIDAADRHTSAFIASLANAYARAWQHHVDVLKAQDVADRLSGELVLGAALALVPGGVGGLVGGVMTALGGGRFVVDGIKDLVKWGGRREGAELAPGRSAAFTAFPADPLAWQNLQVARIKSEMAIATEKLFGWQSKVNYNDPGFFADFDPIVAMDQSLTIAGIPAKALAPVDASMATTFERGFWTTWLERYAYAISIGYRKPGIPFANVREQNGGKIKQRCEEIGLDWAPYAARAARNVEAEADRQNEAHE